MKIIFVAMHTLFVGALLAAPLVFAQAAKMDGAPGNSSRASLDASMARLDTNNDGMLSRDEAKGNKRLAKAFDRIDSNKDGMLSRDELVAFQGKAKARRAAKKGTTGPAN